MNDPSYTLDTANRHLEELRREARYMAAVREIAAPGAGTSIRHALGRALIRTGHRLAPEPTALQQCDTGPAHLAG